MAGRLFEAVSEARFPDVRLLLNLSVNVNCRNSSGQTPIMTALFIEDEQNRDRMFRYLLRRGADVLAEDNSGRTAFLYACQKRRTKQAHRILNAVGAGSVNLNCRDVDGTTPLLYAVKTNNIDLVKLLVQLLTYYHLSVDVPDRDGCTPLILARKLELAEIGDFLYKEGKANPHIADDKKHLNAYEWAEYAKEKREVDEKERKKVQNLIFPPVTRIRRKKLRPRAIRPIHGLKSSPPHSVRDDSEVTSYSAPDVLSGISTTRSSSSSFGTYRRRGSLTSSLPLITDKRPLNKSIDSALTLLEMASIHGDHMEHVDHFVSSQPDWNKHRTHYHHHQHRATEGGDLTLFNRLFSVYAEQQTDSYRKVAKIARPKTPPKAASGKKKVSSLAIVFGRDKEHQRQQRLAARKGRRGGKNGERDSRADVKSKRSRESKKGDGAGFGDRKLAIITEDTEESINRDSRRRSTHKKLGAAATLDNKRIPKVVMAQSN